MPATELRLLRDIWPAAAGPAPALPVSGIASRSQDVSPGAVFVALRGTQRDGHDFIPDAIARGAGAVVVERVPTEPLAVPVFQVEDTRRVLAQLAAGWHHHPAQRLSLVGITGTVGKTSVLNMLEAALLEAGVTTGIIGSLGLRIDGEPQQETPYTSPDALLLQAWLAQLVATGCSLGVMEVTSHALAQQRVHGLRFGVGVFTNLIPLEHAEFHGSFRNYVRAKRTFFDHLADGAPLIYNAEDRAVRRLVHASCATPVGVGSVRTARVRVHRGPMDARGSRMELDVRRPLPRPDGGELEPLQLPLQLRLLGRANVTNAALAATTALSLGVDPAAIARALSRLEPARRRMQVVHEGDFLVLDDTTGHPESLTAVFEIVAALAPRRVHMAFVVRGRRGTRINQQLAEALAIWAERLPPTTLVVSRASDAADERNRVTTAELEAFREPLRRAGIEYLERERLEDAVVHVLEQAAPRDLVLLLGAQGMDQGQRIAREWLDSR